MWWDTINWTLDGVGANAAQVIQERMCLILGFMDIVFMAAARLSIQMTELTRLWLTQVQRGRRQHTGGEQCRTEPHPTPTTPASPVVPLLCKHREDRLPNTGDTPRTPHRASGHPPLAPTHSHARGPVLTFPSQTRPKTAPTHPLHTPESSGTGILSAFCSGSRICFEVLNP